MDVELVTADTADGVQLDGYLRTQQRTDNKLGLDLVICHHGVGGNFYSPSFFDAMGDALLERGSAILRVNNRGHDQVYQMGQRRLGAAYERLDDCRLDYAAWLDFAEKRGFRRIALWGHSLGAVKLVYFLARERDPRVVCAIASSPPQFSYAAYASSDLALRFNADMSRAMALVDTGRAGELIDVLVPVPRVFSAGAYVDKYGPDSRCDYFEHLPAIGVPLLLTLGSIEATGLNFASLAHEGPAFPSRWRGISYACIDGADHSYAGRTDELWLAVSAWLERTLAWTPEVEPSTSRSRPA